MPPRNNASLPVCIERASKTFGRRRLWTDVSFTVHGGQVVALSGPSGSGKTTLLNCLGLLEKLDAGRITYGPRDATHPRQSVRRTLYKDSIGFLFQNSGLVDNWSVRDNVSIAFHGRRIGRKARKQEVLAALDLMGLGGMQNDLVYTLSGGEQQRVGLARLRVKQADVVLVDEPTASLDTHNSEIVIRALRDLADRGAAVVISTHDDRVINTSDGVVRLEAASRDRGSTCTVHGQIAEGPLSIPHQSAIADDRGRYPRGLLPSSSNPHTARG